MRKVEEWLALGDELGSKAAEILVPKPWKHDIKEIESKAEILDKVKCCRKCKKQWFVDDWPEREHACSVPARIDVNDRNAAIRLIRKLFTTPKQQSDFLTELVDVCEEAPIDYLTSEPDFMVWLLFVADAREIIVAACMAKENKK